MHKNRIQKIKEKLQKFRFVYGTLKYNSTEAYKYDWDPHPISISEIELTENYYHIHLPIEYKIFLSEIGNGGLGPSSYPLLHLNKSIQTSGVNRIGKKFPLHRLWLRCGTKEHYYRDWEPEDFLDEDLPTYEDFLAQCRNDLISAEMLEEDDPMDNYIYDLPLGSKETDGTLFLGTSGCGLDFHLILNGEHTGEVWHCRNGGMGPVSTDFLSFIENWLDLRLEKVSSKTVYYYINRNNFTEARFALENLKNTADVSYTNDTLILLEGLIAAKEKNQSSVVLQMEGLLKKTLPISRVNHLMKDCVARFYDTLYSTLEAYTYQEFLKQKKSLLANGVFNWEFDHALARAKKIQPLIPQNNVVTSEIALFYYNMGDFEKFREWDKKIKKDNLFSYNLKGCYALDVTKDFENAVGLFKKALSIKENWLPARSNLGLAYAHSGRFEEAEQLFFQLIEDSPDYSWSYVGLATNYLLQGKLSEAMEQLKIAVLDKDHDAWRIVGAPIWAKCYHLTEYQNLFREVFQKLQ
ncbi:tetratricopeptide repeat protein [Flagellimonas meishanensis]|uniref:tetratricopeptide repeat protein n=1 Tax=Flagellimonas meishanensis TaxID=2873264 RepID=UPI001CA7615A|nr:tetratricopeptide repeat protein [[Muricauda] meishanensis]